MQLSKVLIISLPIALTLLAGCASAPPYQRPAIALPAQFKQATTAAQDAGIWRPVQPQDAPAPEAWWRLYADPDLDRLQQQAASANPGIAQAVARLRAAQAAVHQALGAQHFH
ncbi:MAG TPA: RND transporter, partial [Alicycliphilus sp.]|nr:RND transporter [Alicycliphilus sp.]